MNKTSILLLIFFSLIFTIGKSQKTIEIPSNKNDSSFFDWIQSNQNEHSFVDLTQSQDSLRIRIWMGHQIVEIIKNDNITAYLTTSVHSTKKGNPQTTKSILINRQTSRRLYNLLLSKNITEIPDKNTVGIDGQQYLFEISTPEKYRLYSYWSPWFLYGENDKKVSEILDIINETLNLPSQKEKFLGELEAGHYIWGMRTISVDCFLSDQKKKTDLYKTVEERIRSELNINDQTTHTKFPLILIDEEQRLMKDLNDYKLSQVRSISVLNKDDANLYYGLSGKYGVVIIETE